MKVIKLIVGSTLTLLASSTAFAHSWTDWALKPYVGGDAQIRRMDFKGGFGDNFLQHHSPQGNLYVGLKLNCHLGLEFGYEATRTRTRTVTLTTGDIINGVSLPANMSPAVINGNAKIKGPHVDLVGYYHFYENCPTQLIGSVGVSNLKITVNRITLQAGNNLTPVTRNLDAHKFLLRLMGGLQYMHNEHLGFRGTLGWVNTSKIIVTAKDGGRTSAAVKPKESIAYGLGVLWVF